MPHDHASTAPSDGARCPGFVHLHLHSEYSLLDGGNRIDRLIARVKELGMDAVAITDHGNLHGAAQFYHQARAAGVRPILGIEAYVAPGDRRDRTHTGVADGGYHLVLLAENETGWRNLMYLSSEAFLTGFYYKPRMDRALLEAHNSGLIAINGHLGSEIGEHLLAFEQSGREGHWERALESARWHARVFADEGSGPRFFVELQRHVPEQNAINPHLVRLARGLELPLVCDNDSHFLRREDHDAHDTLICISTGKAKSDPARMKYTPELYVKSPKEMHDLFAGEYDGAGDEALVNTLRIADRCRVELPSGVSHAPVVRVGIPDEGALPRADDPRFGGDLSAWYAAYCAAFTLEPFDATREPGDAAGVKQGCDRALRLLAEGGMVWRYGPRAGAGKDGPERGRLDRELAILADKGISAYFLIVWDFVNWGRQRGIPAIARGSGVGTMVGYVLGLSNACPVRYGLLFERFTDPDRSEYPDIDIDLCQDGRAAVIDYVRRKYGHVAQIITFGTLKARAAVRDVARVMEMSLPDADRLAKLIPEELGITLERALEREPDLRALVSRDELAARVIDNARTIEGQARHAGVHAAGVIVATRPLHEIVPLYRQSGGDEDEIVTQWDGPTCERCGLLKMDFLGLRTLSVIERAKKLIREGLGEEALWAAVGKGAEFEAAKRRSDQATKGSSPSGPDLPSRFHPLDLDRLTYDDPNVFDLFRRGDTTGVFQFESGGMRRLLVEMKPDRLEDLIAANALFRPGPMDLIPDYNRRKHGQDAVPRVHEIVDRHTAETYGVMVYQEQVMQIVHELGGIPLRAAYSLIKAISKKKEKEIAKVRPVFVEGAGSKGLSTAAAEELFELILKFAGYGFNKSHSTGYAIVAYQTAYLKAYFPAQYMAAFLTYESRAQKVSNWIPYLEDTKRTRAVDPATGRVLRWSIEVKPPDINLSQADFAVVFDPEEPRDPAHGHIRFGLGAIKGAGDKAISVIMGERDRGVASRPFASLHEFCERVPQGVVNKATIEALIKSGAFDGLHSRADRAAMVAAIETAVSAGQKLAEDRAVGQGRLFGLEAPPQATNTSRRDAALPRVAPWSEAETLRQEKETLGFYVSNHPLEQWGSWASLFTTAHVANLVERGQDARVVLAVIGQSVRSTVVKKGRSAGQKMAIATVEDLTGAAEAVLFADCYARYGHLLADDQPKFLLGRVDLSRGDPQILVDRLVPIDGVPLERGVLRVTVSEPRLNGACEQAVVRVASALAAGTEGSVGDPLAVTRVAHDVSSGGGVPVELIVETERLVCELKPARDLRARLSPELARALVQAVGEGSVKLRGGIAVELERDARPWMKRG